MDSLNYYRKLYKTFRKRFGSATPLKTDCGKLCGEKCCLGDENDGMLLFPGEEYLYDNGNWYTIKETDIVLPGGYTVKLLVCSGKCPRDERPLSCRIFPVIPYMNEYGRIDFRLDPRSFGICPITQNPEKHPVEDNFIDSLYRAFPPLLKDKNVVDFIEILSEQYDELMEVFEIFSEN